MMSFVCSVVGASPFGGVIVGASPALSVTDGNLLFPPHDVTVVNVIAITAKTANTLIRVLLGIFLLFIRFRRLV
jgi:hypothetical protein